MIDLSSKATGDQLTATEWDNHSKECENVVTSTGRVLSGSENQLVSSIDEFAKSNVYNAVLSTDTYICAGRTITTNATIKEGMQFIINFNATNIGACKLNITSNGNKDLKNSNGLALGAGVIKAGDTYSIIFKNNEFRIVGVIVSAKDYNSELDNFITSSGLTLNAGSNTQLLEADKILSKKENVKKLIENAGITYDVANDNQVSEAVDIFAKSNIYTANLSGSTYTGTRTLTPNSIENGMVFFVKFNSANNGAVNLNLGSGSKDLKNMNGTELRKNMILAGDIVPVMYDGTKFVSCRKLYFKFNEDNIVDWNSTNNATIGNYIGWHDSWGSNPVHKYLYVRISKHEKVISLELLVITNHDGFAVNSDKPTGLVTFDTARFMSDHGLIASVLAKNSGSCTLDINNGGATNWSTSPCNASIYPHTQGGGYANKIGFLINTPQWKGSGVNVTRWEFRLGITFTIKES